MRFKGLDLNLLGIFDALIERLNITRTAEHLHLSQPAVSAALNRLREFFGDPLFVMHGRKMIPTALALQLQPHIRLVLDNADTVVSTTAHFDPCTSTRHFRISASDYLTIVLFRPLLARLADIAPGLTFEIIAPTENVIEILNSGELDVFLSPREYLSSEHPVKTLFEERYVVAGWSQNPLVTEGMSIETFEAAGQVAARIGIINRSSFAESRLRAMDLRRRMDVLVPSFGLVPDLLVGTGRIAVMHERLAIYAAQTLPIKYCSLPFPFPNLIECIQTHRTRDKDAGLNWLVQQITEVAGHQ